jgi:hypothetical protein
MGMRAIAAGVVAAITLSSCQQTETPAPQAVAASPSVSAGMIAGKSGLLLSDGQKVVLAFNEGVASQEQGSQGMGKFLHIYRAASNTFGPTHVIEHTATSLTYRGKRDTCTILIDGTSRCENLGSGTWYRCETCTLN